MGLNRFLASAATARPRVHLVEAPGGAPVRWAVEDALEARGWRRTPSPAAADALVVAGRLPDDLRTAAELLWSQLPGPRVRRHVEDVGEVAEALETLPAALREHATHRVDARDRGSDEVSRFLPDDAEDGHMTPAGIALAEGAEDRDGLEMDHLVHPLGPLLDRWPGGLELRLTIHGDVVADVAVQRAPVTPVAGPAAAWDAVSTTLALVGDDRGASVARRLRRQDSDDRPTDRARLRQRLRRWGRVGILPAAAAEALLAATDTSSTSVPPTDLPALLRGQDLYDVRLLVAAHAPVLLLGEVARA